MTDQAGNVEAVIADLEGKAREFETAAAETRDAALTLRKLYGVPSLAGAEPVALRIEAPARLALPARRSVEASGSENDDDLTSDDDGADTGTAGDTAAALEAIRVELKMAGRPLRMGDLFARTDAGRRLKISRQRFKAILRELAGSGDLLRDGVRAGTTYRLPSGPAKPAKEELQRTGAASGGPVIPGKIGRVGSRHGSAWKRRDP